MAEREKLLVRIMETIISEGPIDLVCHGSTLIASPRAIGTGLPVETAVLRDSRWKLQSSLNVSASRFRRRADKKKCDRKEREN